MDVLSQIASNYSKDEASGVWFPATDGPGQWTYSDGDEVEQRVLAAITQSSDRSSMSLELERWITDWASRYHLSRSRASLLRPFADDLRGTVLEVGAGCGALTRFLGETAQLVVALEPSPRRAAAIAARCSDLPNVVVVCESAGRFRAGDMRFDAALLIGVLEYAHQFSDSPTAALEMLGFVRNQLRDPGLLLLAIENKYGLKYFAGAPEDHTGVPFQGIADQYEARGVRTYSRRELERMVRLAGFASIDVALPQPDYKLPSTVILPAALTEDSSVDVATLVAQSVRADPQLPAVPLFPLEHAWASVFAAGLAADLSNSLLLIARTKPPRDCTRDETLLVAHFSMDRLPEFVTETRIVSTGGEVKVVRRHLGDKAPEENQPITQSLTTEDYHVGQLWLDVLVCAVQRPRWTEAVLHEWFECWLQALQGHVGAKLRRAPETHLAGDVVDAIPRNLLKLRDDKFRFIDQEWSWGEGIELGFLAFRAFFVSLTQLTGVAAPNSEADLAVLDLFFRVAQASGLNITVNDLARYADLENRIQHAVTGKPGGLVLDDLKRARLRVFSDVRELTRGTPVFEAALGSIRALVGDQLEWTRREIELREVDRQRARQELESLQVSLRALEADHDTRLDRLYRDGRQREEDRLQAWRAVERLQAEVEAQRAALAEARALSERLATESEALRLARLNSEQQRAQRTAQDLETSIEAAACASAVARLGALAVENGGLAAKVQSLTGALSESTRRAERAEGELASIGTALASTLRERDQALAQGHELGAQVRLLHARVESAQDQLRSVLASRSWRVTAPLRLIRRGVRALLRGTRRRAESVARWLWHLLPADLPVKRALKEKLFTAAAPVFKGTEAYQRWLEHRQLLQRLEARAAEVRAGESSAPAPVTPAPSTHVPAAVASHTPPPRLPTLPEPEPVPLLSAAPLADAPVRLIAFYLPQFHPIPENDAWWGAGFTEWTNVTRGVAQFVGHYQPHLPGELGFYDLRVPEVQRRQVELAKLYGVGAFCFYLYWFGGRRLLELPIMQYLRDPTLDLPFCLCWANENWSRRWDGLDQEVLIAQRHSPEDDIAFIAHVAQFMRDPRYVRIGGRPLLLVYRPSLLPDARATAERWRRWCRSNGVGEIYVAYTQSFEAVDPRDYGFDAAIEFPPNSSAPPVITDRIERLNPSYSGVVFDWTVFVERSRDYEVRTPPYRLFRGVTPSWDNEARRTGSGTVFWGSNPDGYREWVRNAALDTIKRFHTEDERLVFVNAWNEWAEGAHLEPDRRYGYAWLQATRDGLTDAKEAMSRVAMLSTGGGSQPTPALQAATVERPHSTQAAFERRRVVLVSHDAHPHGAQLLALHLARMFSETLGFGVDLVVLGDGILKAEYARYATVHDLSGIDPAGEHARSLARRLLAAGATSALCNTTVSGKFLETLKQSGFWCVSLIHEMPGVVREYGLAEHAQAIARSADHVVFAADIVAAGFAEFASVPAERCRIRPQGLYRRNRFRRPVGTEAARGALRDSLSLPRHARVVLGVGYADRRKGIDLFIAAGQRLMAKRDDVYFVWVGHHDQTLWPEIEAAVKASGFSERFVFPGRQADTDIYYAGADVYALASREDPFPSVVMEALEVGVPVVAFAGTGGCCELIAAGAGLLAPAFDVDAFAAAVDRLLTDADLACRYGQWGAGRVREEFSFRRYAFDLAAWLNLPLKRVSVAVPNYNYAHFLRERLESIANQTYPVFEVLILDDASTDDSLTTLNEILSDYPLDARLIINEANSGSVFKQWRKGVDVAQGELVWIAEADDLADPGFLTSVIGAFDDPEVVLSYCQSRQMQADGSIMCEHYLEYTADVSREKWLRSYTIDGREEICTALAVKNTIPNVSAVLFKRPVLAEALKECADQLQQFRVAGDWFVYVHVLSRGKLAYVPESLNSHRRHDRGVTISSFNLEQLKEIISMQRFVRKHFGTDAKTTEIARAYAQTLYVQFGLSAIGPESVEDHPALSRVFE